MDDYGVKNKVAFDIAYSGHKNEQENISFVREMSIKQEAAETSEVVEMCQRPLLSTPVPRLKKGNANDQKREKQSASAKFLLKLQ